MTNLSHLINEMSSELSAMSVRSPEDNRKLAMALCRISKINQAEKASSESMEVLLQIAASSITYDSVKSVSKYSNRLDELLTRNVTEYEKVFDIILGKLE